MTIESRCNCSYHFAFWPLLVVLLCFLQNNGSAQSIKFRGTLTDSLGSPIVFANVVVTKIDSQDSPGFTLTNYQGFFELDLESNSKYIFTFLHVNYLRLVVSIDAKTNRMTQKFILKEVVKNLGEVTVIYEIPIQVKTDSIIYNVTDFTNGTERKLKEALMKLPGVEVNRNGKVKLMGKIVNEVLIEGNTFFNGTTKLAVENIPADAIDKIEFIDNYNKVKFLRGLENTDKLVMNLKLKEDKKKLLFGDIEALGGVESRYKFKPTLFYYDPSFSINLLGDINNVGDKALSIDDYIGFQNPGQFLVNAEGFIKSINDLNDYFFERNHEFYEEKFGALNIQSSSAKTDLNSFAMISDSRTELRSANDNSFFKGGDLVLSERRFDDGVVNTVFGLGKINIDHIPSKSKFVNSNTTFRGSVTEEYSNIQTNSVNTSQSILHSQNLGNFTIQQFFKYDHNISKKNTFGITSLISLSNRTPENSWISRNNIFPIELEESNSSEVTQVIDFEDVNYSLGLKDYIILNRYSHIALGAGIKGASNILNSQTSQRLSIDRINNLDDKGFGNDIKNSLTDYFLSFEYKFKKDKLTLAPGMQWHYYTWNTDQRMNSLRRKLFFVNPTLNGKFDIGKTEELTFDYSLDNTFPYTGSLAVGRILRNFNQVYLGNPQLHSILSHQFKLTYNKYNLIRGKGINIDLNHSERPKNIVNNIDLTGINIDLTQIIITFPSRQTNLSFEYTKKFSHFNTATTLGFQSQSGRQVINEREENNSSRSLSGSFNIETAIEDFPTIRLDYIVLTNDYISSSRIKFISHVTELSIEHRLSSDLLFNFNGSYTLQQNRTNSSESQFLLGSAYWRYQQEISAWSFELRVTNLFNSSFIQENTFSSFLASDTRVFVQPRIITIGVVYKL
jgi:hypothetical protein